MNEKNQLEAAMMKLEDLLNSKNAPIVINAIRELKNSPIIESNSYCEKAS